MNKITKQLQEVELEIFKHFLCICKQENLHYFLIGGTLLGAVRHKGFIPWDDDIDVGMPRSDYDKFISCAQKHLPPHYFLQTHQTDSEYPYPFAKIRDNRTLYKEQLLDKLNINHGIWIDIFPLDFCAAHHKWFDIKHFWYKKRTSCRMMHHYTIKSLISHALSCLLIPSWKDSITKRDALICSFPTTSPLIANFCGAWGNKEIVPKEWFGEGVSLQFEGLTVVGPLHYDKWLTQVYGNYKQLPPIEKRISRHAANEIKFEI